MSLSSDPLVAVLALDPAMTTCIQEVAAATGARAAIAANAPALRQIIDRWPVLALVDLAVPGWETVVRWAKTQPHTKAIPMIAFSGNMTPEIAYLAHAAGCNNVLTHADLRAELPGLLDTVLHPPTRWLEGWDAPPPPALCHGIAQFNAGEYWACHETLEELWVSERRPIRDLYQGILQVGVAFHHLQQRNYAGASKMFRRGLPRLRGLPEVCQGAHVAELVTAARAVHDAAATLGAERIGELDLAILPKVVMMNC